MEARNSYGSAGLVAVFAVFIVAVTLANVAFRGIRLDLTENSLYTLSDGTISILESIPEPINVYFFYSDKAAQNVPALRTYASRVREMLQEFEQHADGRLTVTVIDPLPFSEQEDRAAEFGLQSINLGASPEPIYFGIAATNSIGDQEIIPFLDPSKESFLEYDLAKLIYALSEPEKPVIGLLSGLQMTAGFDPATQQMTQPWIIADQISQLYELRQLPKDLDRIDDEIDLLMVVHPKDLTDKTLYALDQYILGGGHALLFVDPYAEADRSPAPTPGMPPMSGASNLNRLLEAWGVSIDPEHVVGDDRFALTVTGLGNRPVRYLPMFGVDRTGMDQDDVITAGLSNVNLGFPGHIEVAEDATATVTPLLQSSDLAGLIPVATLAFMQDPDSIRQNFAPADHRLVLAARIQGEVPSAFPDGLPAPPGSDPGAETTPDEGLRKAAQPINVVLVADTDLLTDRLWAQVQNIFGQRLTTAFAGNGDFVVNALDNLSGSSALISIRGRATYTRPFTRVEDLRREAEERFRSTEEGLQQQLQQLESRLAELQANREDSGVMILSPEQAAELERFKEERLRVRKELRKVRRELDQSIEDLGTWLKVINIGLMPALITILVLVMLGVRRRHRSAH